MPPLPSPTHSEPRGPSAMPPLPSPTYGERGPPPPPPYYGYPGSPGYPPPPPPNDAVPSPLFSYHSGSNPSAFGRYNSSTSSNDGRHNSLTSLGSSVDAFYDRRDSGVSAASASAASAGPRDGGAGGAGDPEGAGPKGKARASPITENPASAGTPMDYSKIAELIRDSSENSRERERSASWVEGDTGGENHEDGILRSQSEGGVGGVAPVGAVPAGGPRGEMGAVSEDGEPPTTAPAEAIPRQPSLLRKLSGGALSRQPPRLIHTPTTSRIVRPSPIIGKQHQRPDHVKRDTSNQPESVETKRSVKRVVLSRDQSAVSRKLKEAQGLGGGGAASSQLTKSEIIRNLSVSINELGLHDTLSNVRNLSCGAPQLDRMTTEDVMSLIDHDDILDAGGMAGAGPSTPVVHIGTTPISPQMPPHKPMVATQRVTTIDGIAMDIHNGSNVDWDDSLDLIQELPSNNSGVEDNIAEKWLKGETS